MNALFSPPDEEQASMVLLGEWSRDQASNDALYLVDHGHPCEIFALWILREKTREGRRARLGRVPQQYRYDTEGQVTLRFKMQ